ncbi:3-keto-disaccharide hydrolase, partial [Singulisphaera rosea]
MSPRAEDLFETLIKSLEIDSAHKPASSSSGGGAGSSASRPRVSLFNGKNLDGWTAMGESGEIEPSRHWSVRDGILHGWGGPTHLFSTRGDYENVLIKAEVMINDGGNSGLYFRAQRGPGFPLGYEAQINSTHRDPVKTGSLYRMPMKPITFTESPIPHDTWFTLVVQAVGPGIRVWVDDKLFIDWADSQNTYRKGYVTLQAQGPETHVQIRKLEVVELDGARDVGSRAALAARPKDDASADSPAG